MEAEFMQIGQMAKSHKFAALFQDFDGPLYNVWKRQVNIPQRTVSDMAAQLIQQRIHTPLQIGYPLWLDATVGAREGGQVAVQTLPCIESGLNPSACGLVVQLAVKLAELCGHGVVAAHVASAPR